jgi:hypothetical protein
MNKQDQINFARIAQAKIEWLKTKGYATDEISIHIGYRVGFDVVRLADDGGAYDFYKPNSYRCLGNPGNALESLAQLLCMEVAR